MRLRPCLAIGLLALTACAHRAGRVAPERARIESGQAMAHVRYLASDALEGRGVKTAGLDRAASYIAGEFARYGLEPAGDRDEYFQRLKLPLRGRIQEGALALAARPLTRGEDFAVLASSSSGEVPLAEVLFVGYGVTAPEHGYDDYAGIEAKGRIVLALRRLPESSKIDERYADTREKIENARRHGAAGILVVARASDKDELPHAADASEDLGLVAHAVRRAIAEEIIGQKIATLEHERPGRIGAMAVRMHAKLERTEVTVKNVVGLLRGSDPVHAQEAVVVGAHYDHLGRGFPQSWNPHACKGVRPGMIFAGADDNASGTSALLEIAEAFAGAARPRRSVLFVAFVAEEMGLLGSNYFVEHPPIPIGQVAAMINLDMVGRLRESDGISLEGAATALEWRAIVDRANTEHLRVRGAPMIVEDSDHAPFFRHDRPVLFFFTGTHPDYHCHTDRIEKINAEGLAKVSRFAYRIARDLAEQRSELAGLHFTKAPVAKRAAGGGGGPRLGIAPDYTTQGGLGVSQVIEGGPAAKAGLKAGDLITMFGGQEIAGIEDYMAHLASHKFGDVVDIVIRRGASSVTLQVKLERLH